MKVLTPILNLAYGLLVILFVLDFKTRFDIVNQDIKQIIYYGMIVATPVILVWNIISIKFFKGKTFWIMFPSILLIILLFIGPMSIVFNSGAWQTQTILYEHVNSHRSRVEFQMRDVGALGFQKRTVEVRDLTRFLIVTKEIDDDFNPEKDWVRVDKEVNQLEIKFP
jgi:hypothetical protein